MWTSAHLLHVRTKEPAWMKSIATAVSVLLDTQGCTVKVSVLFLQIVFNNESPVSR